MRVSITWYVCAVLSFLFHATHVSAQNLSEIETYSRCVYHITGSRPVVSNDPTSHWMRIKTGTLGAVDACMEILRKARLTPQGLIPILTDETAQKVLRNFHRVHRSFFSNNDLNGLVSTASSGAVINDWIYDADEPAHSYTWALFHPQGNVETVLTHAHPLEAQRLSYEAQTTPSYEPKQCCRRLMTNNQPVTLAPLSNLKYCGEHTTRLETSCPQVRCCKVTRPYATDASFEINRVNQTEDCVASTETFDGGLNPTQHPSQTRYSCNDPLRRLVAYDALTNTASAPVSFQSDQAGHDPNSFFVQVGILVGLKPINSTHAKYHHTSDYYLNQPRMPYYRSLGCRRAGNTVTEQGCGGGVLGSPVYGLLNYGRPNKNELMDGGARLPRKWSEHVIRDLLCRSLPVVRASDAAPWVVNPKQPAAPFRDSAGCTVCHSSIDSMAGTMGNQVIRQTHDSNSSTPNVGHLIRLETNGVARLPFVNGVFMWPGSNPNFAVQEPDGKLFFRDYAGDLIDIDVRGIAELGASIALTKQYSACVASKYMKHFLGYDINLDDPEADHPPVLSTQQAILRNHAIKLGTELKEHKSIERLIESIMKLSTYRKTDGGTP